MIDMQTTLLLRELLARYGLAAAILTLATVVALGLLALWTKNRIEAWRTEAADQARERQAHAAFLQGLVTQHQTTTNLLASGISSLKITCAEHCATLLSIRQAQDAHVAEERAGRAVLHEQLSAIQLEVARTKHG